MFDRFTEDARKSMSLARQEAFRFNHDYIGTEHMLLGVAAVEDGVAARALRGFGVDPRAIRTEVDNIVKNGTNMITYGQLPFTPRGKRVLEYSLEEARSLGHEHVGTEHLLLGLVREHDGIAAQVLRRLGVTVELARAKVIELVPAGRDVKPAPPERDDFGSDDGFARIFAVAGDRSRTQVKGDGVVVAFSDGREVRVSFSTLGECRRCVALCSEFHAPGTAPPPRVPTGVPDVVTAIVLHPGEGNTMRVTVKARRRGDGQNALAEEWSAPTRSFFACNGDIRTPVDAASIVMDMGNGHHFALGDVGAPDDAGFVSLVADSQLWIRVGACDFVQVAVR